MQLAETAKLFTAYGLWRATGWAVAGRTLIAALGSSDANNRMIAGMFLVKGGRLALPLVAEALEKGRGLPLILNVAGDLGHTELAPLVERYTAAPDAVMVARCPRARPPQPFWRMSSWSIDWQPSTTGRSGLVT